jgi:hypothetical protein
MPPRRWVWEQYDTLIQGNSLQTPAAMPAWCGRRARKALAFSSDVTPRYVEADPYEGGKQAVAECWRNLTAVGRRTAGGHRQPQFRQSRTPGDHGPVRFGHQRASAKPAGARFPDRLGQCLALQRDQWRGDPAHAHHRVGLSTTGTTASAAPMPVGAGVPFRHLGKMSGDSLTINGLFSLPLSTLRATHESWFPAFMDVPETLAAE